MNAASATRRCESFSEPWWTFTTIIPSSTSYNVFIPIPKLAKHRLKTAMQNPSPRVSRQTRTCIQHLASVRCPSLFSGTQSQSFRVREGAYMLGQQARRQEQRICHNPTSQRLSRSPPESSLEIERYVPPQRTHIVVLPPNATPANPPHSSIHPDGVTRCGHDPARQVQGEPAETRTRFRAPKPRGSELLTSCASMHLRRRDLETQGTTVRLFTLCSACDRKMSMRFNGSGDPGDDEEDRLLAGTVSRCNSCRS